MPIHQESHAELKALRQHFPAHEPAAPSKVTEPDLPPPAPVVHGAGGGALGAIAGALSHWHEPAGKQSAATSESGQESKLPVPQNAVQAGVNLEMQPLAVPMSALNPQAQSVVAQGGMPVRLLGGSMGLGGDALQSETAQAGSGPQGVNWSEGHLPENLDQRVEGYGIQTIVNPDGTIVVTSNNIQVQVQSLGPQFDAMFEGKSEAEINAMLTEWRQRKDADDTLAYGGQGTEDLRAQATESDYYGSEQHVVWATAASARTGGRIPPEFFMEFDPFGGTAGNGPEIINPGDWAGGGAGGMLSTIAMGHDTDWDLGRYMGVGPLNELHDLNPTNQAQMALMGTVGLMPAEAALATAAGKLPPELQNQLAGSALGGGLLGGIPGLINGASDGYNQLRNSPEYAPFFNAIDANASGSDFYSTGNAAWDVNYTWDYIAQNTNGEDWNAIGARPIMAQYQFTPEQCSSRRRHDLDDLIQQHSPGHSNRDDREPA